MRTGVGLLAALVGATLLAGCQNAPEPTAVKVYEVKGKVVAVDKAKGTVTLDHEDIPGLMRAMKMEFKADAAVLDVAGPGDAVQGKLAVRASDYTLTELHKR